MEINWKLLPIKVHYLIYLGALSPIMPFLVVIVRQLGIPIVTYGTISFITFFITVIAKPLIGVAADAFPNARKAIFVCVLAIMYFGLSGICFLPPMFEQIVLEGQSVVSYRKLLYELNNNYEYDTIMHLNVPKTSECFVSEAWDCMIPCDFNGSRTIVNVKHIVLEQEPRIELFKNSSASALVYKLAGEEQSSCDPYQQLKFDCKGGFYTGDGCRPLLSVGIFWIFLLIYLAANICYTASVSITDAICVDSIGENGSYGAQRAWGTVGWGVMAPISGILVDWWSGNTYSKDFTPIIVIVMGLGILDLMITSIKLNVPKFDGGGNIWKKAGSVLREPIFLLFLAFVVMHGIFDGVIAVYIFVLQEDMAKGTVYVKYMKFIQGATIAIQCSLEAPFMWMFPWFLRRMSAVSIMKIVFFLYIIRMFSLALVGSYGPVWATLLGELLNGPCFGLGFTAIVVQAGNISPPGTSATIQSVVNICYESIGYGLSSLIGGLIYQQIGASGIYYVYGVMAIITFIAYLLFANILSTLQIKPAKEDENGSIGPIPVKIPISNGYVEEEEEKNQVDTTNNIEFTKL